MLPPASYHYLFTTISFPVYLCQYIFTQYIFTSISLPVYIYQYMFTSISFPAYLYQYILVPVETCSQSTIISRLTKSGADTSAPLSLHKPSRGIDHPGNPQCARLDVICNPSYWLLQAPHTLSDLKRRRRKRGWRQNCPSDRRNDSDQQQATLQNVCLQQASC